MITLRKSKERGRADHGWLKSWHTFSFAGYHDPRHMNYRALRVINDDTVAAGGGFPTHPHRDMEIITYVIEGALAHRDSMGNCQAVTAGQVQAMTAGSGVSHSEFNASADEAVHFLQIWIMPRERGLPPQYREFKPTEEQANSADLVLASPDPDGGGVNLQQDVTIRRGKLAPGETYTQSLGAGRGAWVQMFAGSVELEGKQLAEGDAAAVEEVPEVTLVAGPEGAQFIYFDLA